MEVISMNGEVAQICDIAIYARYALKTKNKIAYTPSKYENKIEFCESKDNGLNVIYKEYRC